MSAPLPHDAKTPTRLTATPSANAAIPFLHIFCYLLCREEPTLNTERGPAARLGNGSEQYPNDRNVLSATGSRRRGRTGRVAVATRDPIGIWTRVPRRASCDGPPGGLRDQAAREAGRLGPDPLDARLCASDRRADSPLRVLARSAALLVSARRRALGTLVGRRGKRLLHEDGPRWNQQ